MEAAARPQRTAAAFDARGTVAVEGSPDDEAGRARLGPDRWESYRRLGRELRYRELAAESGAAAAERKRWRWVHEEVERLGRAVARGRRAPEGAP